MFNLRPDNLCQCRERSSQEQPDSDVVVAIHADLEWGAAEVVDCRVSPEA